MSVAEPPVRLRVCHYNGTITHGTANRIRRLLHAVR